MSTNATLAARHRDAIPRGVSCATLVYPQRAENAEVWDVEGRRYLDFAAGIAVLNVGHRHPRIIAAVQEQLSRFTHTAFQVLPYEGYVELAERLNGLAPIAGKAKTLFFTTGAEAAENAVKIARAATGRSGVIAFAGGFHGRSVYASALTGKVSPYKAPFGPMPAGVFHAPFPSEETGVTVEASLAMLDFIFRADIAPADVAAIIIEPVQGEGGFHIASTEFLRALRAICDTHGIMLIADEVQTGFARTGKMFAIEHSGVSPDLVSMAKSLGGGFPIAAVTCGDHGRGAAWWPWRHICRLPGCLRGGPRRARCDRGGKSLRPRQCHRRPQRRAAAQLRDAQRSRLHRRDPDAGCDDGVRSRRRSGARCLACHSGQCAAAACA